MNKLIVCARFFISALTREFFNSQVELFLENDAKKLPQPVKLKAMLFNDMAILAKDYSWNVGVEDVRNRVIRMQVSKCESLLGASFVKVFADYTTVDNFELSLFDKDKLLEVFMKAKEETIKTLERHEEAETVSMKVFEDELISELKNYVVNHLENKVQTS